MHFIREQALNVYKYPSLVMPPLHPLRSREEALAFYSSTGPAYARAMRECVERYSFQPPPPGRVTIVGGSPGRSGPGGDVILTGGRPTPGDGHDGID